MENEEKVNAFYEKKQQQFFDVLLDVACLPKQY